MFLGAGLLMASTIAPSSLSPVLLGLYVMFIYIVRVLFNTYLQKEATDKNRATITSVQGFGVELFGIITFIIFAIASEAKDYTLGIQITGFVIAVFAILFSILKRRLNLTNSF
jgi:hypothetical protein